MDPLSFDNSETVRPVRSSSPVPFNVVEYLNDMQDEEKILFSSEFYEIDAYFPVTYNVFQLLLDIANKFSSNRNKGMWFMLYNTDSNFSKTEAQISNLVRSYNRYVERFKNKPNFSESMNIIFVQNETKLAEVLEDIFDIEQLIEGILEPKIDFNFTNELFIAVCRLKQQFKNITWESISLFISNFFCVNPIPSQNIYMHFKTLKQKLNSFSHSKNYKDRDETLQEKYHVKFIADKSISLNEENVIDHDMFNVYRENIDELNTTINELKESFNISEKSILEKDEQFNVLVRKNRKVSHELIEFKKKSIKLSEELDEGKFSVRNVNKREKRKEEKIEQLKNEKNELGKKVSQLKEDIEKCTNKYNNERKRVCYYKNKLAESKSMQSQEIKDMKENIIYYENLTDKLKDEIDSFEKENISTYKNGRYSDEIRSVYYELLKRNVGVINCGEIIKLVLEK